MNQVAIIIPVYQKFISEDEVFSLNQARKFLSSFPFIFIAPDGYTPPKELGLQNSDQVIHFSKSNFESVRTYSKLLLTADFYHKFLNFEYIFIYQLDGLVLSNNLAEWCSKNYSYIGAPLMRSTISFLTHPNHKFNEVVGNGGVSLRRVKDHYELLKVNSLGSENQHTTLFSFFSAVLTGKSSSIWIKGTIDEYPFNEDGFWAFEASKYDQSFKVAPVEVAAAFAVERDGPQLTAKYLDGKLPFSVHAWKKYDFQWWKLRLAFS